MMKRSILAALILCMITASTISAHAETYIPHLEVSTENIYFTAGKQGELIIKINNSGGYDVFEIENIITSNTPGIAILSNTHKVINKIKYQENASYSVTLDIDQNIPVGAYTLQLQHKYVRLDSQIALTIPLTIIVNQAYVPSIRVIASPESTKLNANYDGEFTYIMENIGNADIQNLTIAVASVSPFITISEGQRKTVSEMKIGEKMSVAIKVRVLESAALGPYSFSAYLNYVSEGKSLRQSSTFSFEVTSPKNPIIVVKNMSPGLTVIPGKSFRVDLKIVCSDAIAYNVKAQLGLDQRGLLAPLSSTSISLGDLKPGVSVDMSYDLQVDGSAAPGQLSFLLTLSYLNSKGIPMSTSEVITVNVDEFVTFRVFKDRVFSLERGKVGVIESDLLLVGLSRVDFASVSVVGGGVFESIVGSSEYVGAVDPDSPVPFTVRVKVSSDAVLGDDVVRAKVEYLDHRNVFREKELDLHVSIIEPVVQNNAAADTGFWGWIRSILGIKP